ncbi:MAG: glyoxalase [Anaerolineae bacterium]|nr:MAG: glyoxalase [Anaerolineae bacterium]
MKIDAVAVSSSDFTRTLALYRALGFEFPAYSEEEQHIEAVTPQGSARLMIDSKSLMTELIGEAPRPGNHSAFAIRYDSPAEVDAAAERVKAAGFTLATEPWDAFWGQRYAVAQDPDGYRVDLYAPL